MSNTMVTERYQLRAAAPAPVEAPPQPDTPEVPEVPEAAPENPNSEPCELPGPDQLPPALPEGDPRRYDTCRRRGTNGGKALVMPRVEEVCSPTEL